MLLPVLVFSGLVAIVAILWRLESRLEALEELVVSHMHDEFIHVGL